MAYFTHAPFTEKTNKLYNRTLDSWVVKAEMTVEEIIHAPVKAMKRLKSTEGFNDTATTRHRYYGVVLAYIRYEKEDDPKQKSLYRYWNNILKRNIEPYVEAKETTV